MLLGTSSLEDINMFLFKFTIELVFENKRKQYSIIDIFYKKKRHLNVGIHGVKVKEIIERSLLQRILNGIRRVHLYE